MGSTYALIMFKNKFYVVCSDDEENPREITEQEYQDIEYNIFRHEQNALEKLYDNS